jgi:two-component system, NarL family, response regulator LiaR
LPYLCPKQAIPLKRTILIYGISLAALTGLLKYVEYQFIIKELRLEFYIGVVAVFFTGLGVWMGLKLTKPKPIAIAASTLHIEPKTSQPDEAVASKIGISKRELEVLQLISEGLSNQEIADRLFVSLNTIKTHSSNLFIKLDVKRRTQAIQKAKEIGLIR